MTLTLDKMGRLVVPKTIRDRFHLKPGDELELGVEEDGIKLRPRQPTSALTNESGILVCSSELPASGWDLASIIDQERNLRSRDIGQF